MSPVQILGVGAVSVVAAAPIMGLFVSPLYEIRSGHTDVNIEALHHALGMGAAITVLAGIAASAATNNSAPFFGAFIGAGVVFALYEWALRNPVKRG